MHLILVSQLAVLLALANGTPVIAKRIMGRFLDQPIDGGATFFDGQPLFGPTKTIRGIAISVVVTTVGALVIGFGWFFGFLIALTAMFGDLLSSFLKRRLRRPSSSRSTGLDQIPESLLPVLACQSALGLTFIDITVVVIIFFIGEIALSRVLFKWHVRDKPY
jgi:CDP-2,3-bis-(O-geranylgeranyl)-sn-glycerol synthase